jgi:hypothetical protein
VAKRGKVAHFECAKAAHTHGELVGQDAENHAQPLILFLEKVGCDWGKRKRSAFMLAIVNLKGCSLQFFENLSLFCINLIN